MSERFYSIITDIGLLKIQEALLNGTKLDLKYIAVGDSSGNYYEPEKSQMTLRNEKYRTEIQEVSALVAKALIPNDIGGFYIKEVGVFDSENNLILVAKQPETYKPTEVQGSIKELWIKVSLLAIDADVIEIKIDPSIQNASVEYVLNLIGEHTHPDLMPIWVYDTNGDGIVDSCEFIDGGKFNNGEDIAIIPNEGNAKLIMNTNIYDTNNNGIVDNAENIDAGEF